MIESNTSGSATRDAAVAGGGDDGLRERMLGASFGRRDQRQQLGLVERRRRRRVGELRVPLVRVPVLSRIKHVELVGGLERLGGADEDRRPRRLCPWRP